MTTDDPPAATALASDASGQRGTSCEVGAHSGSEDVRAETPVFAGLCCERAGDTHPEPGSSARPDCPNEKLIREALLEELRAQRHVLTPGKCGEDVAARTKFQELEPIGIRH